MQPNPYSSDNGFEMYVFTCNLTKYLHYIGYPDDSTKNSPERKKTIHFTDNGLEKKIFMSFEELLVD